MQVSPASHAAIEGTAFLTLLGVLAKILPPIATFLAIIWYSVVIWESAVGKRWRQRWRRLICAILTREPLTLENKLMMLLASLFAGGFMMTIIAVERIMQ